MDEGSSRTLTGDSYVTSFSGDLQGIDANGYRLFADGTEVPWSETSRILQSIFNERYIYFHCQQQGMASPADI